MPETTRRGFFGLLAGAGAAVATGWRRFGARRLRADQIGRHVQSYEEGGRTVWEFAHHVYRRSDGTRLQPVEVGERVCFDGSPYGAPTIDGVVAEVDDDVDDPHLLIQHVTVESRAHPA